VTNLPTISFLSSHQLFGQAKQRKTISISASLPRREAAVRPHLEAKKKILVHSRLTATLSLSALTRHKLSDGIKEFARATRKVVLELP
jgi:hypothetical protein